MGWELIAAAEVPATPITDSSSQSTTTALIAVLGTVLVALVTVGLPLLFRQARTSESPPLADPKLGERVAVLEHVDGDQRRTLDQLDRHVDGQGRLIDGALHRITDLEQWRQQHARDCGERGQP